MKLRDTRLSARVFAARGRGLRPFSALLPGLSRLFVKLRLRGRRFRRTALFTGDIGRAVAGHHAVSEVDYPGRVLSRESVVVRDHYDQSVAGYLGEQPHDLHARLAVQRSRGLVGEDDVGIAREGSRYRHALHLPAGQPAGLSGRVVPHTHLIESGERAGAAFLFAFAAYGETHLDILYRGEMRDEVVTLEDETYAAIAVSVPVSVLVVAGGHPVHDDVAVGVAIKSAYDVEERRLAAARRSQDSDEFAGTEGDGNALQNMDGILAHRVIFDYVFDLEHIHLSCASRAGKEVNARKVKRELKFFAKRRPFVNVNFSLKVLIKKPRV